VLVISPHAARGIQHRVANITDVLATIEQLQSLGSVSPFDRVARPLRDAFTAAPDTDALAVLWRTVNGTAPAPAPRRASMVECIQWPNRIAQSPQATALPGKAPPSASQVPTLE
jgi:hypothetical protein